jgi:hypothetical protein
VAFIGYSLVFAFERSADVPRTTKVERVHLCFRFCPHLGRSAAMLDHSCGDGVSSRWRESGPNKALSSESSLGIRIAVQSPVRVRKRVK